ncbi:GspH/FimT family protein [Trinickia dinghuensis]|uniref:Type II secretion system protein H n=1 Tax=Trinickia dinghuensis TaxID=2291023 RepID=A0A3D8JSF8_9BURK|nr:GspH/FimT family protein [Trinickia dinghuensis]RDU95958.1 prepilin-type N-terminal cleavage/methylation domain-containing protein [Trinickia dinghuensis]
MQDGFERGRAGRRRRSRCRGFSLVELLVVTVLVASAAMAAAPVFSEWHARDRVDGAARALLAGLTLARGEAIARGARVVVCAADGAPRCVPSGHACARGALGWSCGWAVVVEPRRNGQALRIHRRLAGVSIATAAARVEFTPPAGQVIGGFRKFEFSVAGRSDDRLRRCVRIAAGGRSRLEAGGCGRRAGA